MSRSIDQRRRAETQQSAPRSRKSAARLLAAAAIASCLLAAVGCNEKIHLGALPGVDGSATPGDGRSDGPASALLWSATFEPGDLTEWTFDGNGGISAQNVTSEPTATDEMAHGGRFSGKAEFSPRLGMDSLSYFFRQKPSPPEAYYGAWFYLPADLSVGLWVSLVHFRGSETGDGRSLSGTWDVNVYRNLAGQVVAHVYNFATAIVTEQPFPPVPFPLGRWVHLEVLLRKATNSDGALRVWQDGRLIVQIDGVPTVTNDWTEWDVGGGADDTAGAVYVDDATISLERVGVTR
jgi:hypothetical protein